MCDLENIWSTHNARGCAWRFYSSCLNNIYSFIALYFICMYLIDIRINNIKVISK